MTLNEKILCCHGNLTAVSTAKVLGCTYARVYNVWYRNNKFISEKYPHLSASQFKQ